MRSLFSKQSLNRKLTLSVVAAVLSGVVIIAGAALWHEADRHTKAKVDFLSGVGGVFSSATSDAVARGDRRGAIHALRGVAQVPDVLYARVSTADGEMLAQIGSGVSLSTDARLNDGETPSVWTALQSGTIELTRPIVEGGANVGSVTLVADNSDMLPGLLKTLAQTLVGGLAALLIGALIATRLQQWLVRPLLRLTETVRHVSASHDYTARAVSETDDEVGELCAGFNVMLGEIQARERKIIDLAIHDSETDLPNRVAFERAIAARLAENRAGTLIVAAVGIDRFQYLRGFVGYHMMSDLLGELGARTAAMTRGIAARISPDTIGFLFDSRDETMARGFMARVLAELEAPIALGADQIDLNLTLGFTPIHEDATPQSLIERASIALDQARAAHAKMALFNDDAYTETARNLSLMNDMMRALGSGEMSIVLQPKLDIRADQVRDAEVLMRWKSPTRGFVSPDTFIAMAEETGAIAQLTIWVLQESIACQRRLTAAGFPIGLAVNLSARLVDDADFISAALVMLRSAGAPIRLEITETSAIGDPERALRNIAALAEAGAGISIDDYGSGMSSLAYLKRIPADELKIDKTFVQSLGEQKRDALLVKSTIDLAHSLGMKVVAEGVETEIVLAALSAMGCDCAQGYYVSHPLPEADLLNFLRRRQQILEAPQSLVKA